MLSQSEAPDYSIKEMVETVMIFPQYSTELPNVQECDTTGVDSSNWTITKSSPCLKCISTINTYFSLPLLPFQVLQYLKSFPLIMLIGKSFAFLQIMVPMKMPVYQSLVEKKQNGKKSFAVLVDPDKVSTSSLNELVTLAVDAKVDYFLVGGSLVVTDHLDACIQQIKSLCNIPVLLFPGSPSQISKHADALLYLSLISGRNADMLIGQHVISAPFVKKSGLEILSTGYMVIDGGASTTVSYISNATPIPSDKPDIALCTALAGEMLGMKIIYMDSGSGAKKAISEEMISTVAQNIEVPIIVGGGIRDAEKAYLNCKAGADVIVVGNAIEKNASLISEIAAAIHQVHLIS